MHRILDLYDHPPADGRVICVDEFGPLNLLPRTGKAWRPQTTDAGPRTVRRTNDQPIGNLKASRPRKVSTKAREPTHDHAG
jgi:hypothetical protein